MARSSSARLQPFGVEAPELRVGAVGLHQFAVGIEDGDRRRQRVDDRAQMRESVGCRGRSGVGGRGRPGAQIRGLADRQVERHELEAAGVGDFGGCAVPLACERLIGRVGEGDLAARSEQHCGVGQVADDLLDLFGAARQTIVRLVQRRPHAQRHPRPERPAHGAHLPVVP